MEHVSVETGLTVKAARLEGMASLLSQAGERTRGVQGKLVSRSIDLMPQTRRGTRTGVKLEPTIQE